jgi:hypothetical protein
MRLEKNKRKRRENILQENILQNHHTLGVKRESSWKALTFDKGKCKKESIKIGVVITVVVVAVM